MELKQNVIKNVNDFHKLKNDWKSIENGKDMTVYQSYDWNELLCEQYFSFEYNKLFSNLCVFVLKDDKKTKVIAPLIVQEKSIGIRIHGKMLGRKKGIYFLGLKSYSDYMNFIYNDVLLEELDFVLSEVHKLYKNLNIYLDNVRDNTVLSNFCISKKLPDKLSTSVYIKLSENKDFYNKILSKNTKQNLRTALNRIEKSGFNYNLIIKNGMIEKNLIKELDSINNERSINKNLNKTNFFNKIYSMVYIKYLIVRKKIYNITNNSMERMNNSLTVIVKFDDNIVGYLYGLKDNRSVRIMQNCFKDYYSFYSPLFRGAYDFILQSIDNKQLDEIDFTRGNEPYKLKLGGEELLLHHFEIR